MADYMMGIQKILSAYQPGSPALPKALHTLVQTAEEHARSTVRDEIAQTVCEGIHQGPGKGLKCRACYETELSFPIEDTIIAEIEANKGG